MSAVITISILSMLLFISIAVNKKLFTYTNIFILEWLIIVFFSSIKYDNYYEIKPITFIVITIGVLAFFCGSIIYKTLLVNKRFVIGRARNYTNNLDFSNKVIKLFLFIHILSSIYFTLKSAYFLMNGYSFSYLRNIYQGYDANALYITNQFEEVFRNWVALPLEIVLPTIAVSLYISKRKINHFYLFLLIDQILYLFYSQNKGALAFIVIYLFIVATTFWKKLPTIVRRNVKRIIIIGSVTVIVLFAIRNSYNNNYTLLETLYKYVCGCVNMLNEKIIMAESNHWMTFGMSSIFGFITLIEVVLGVTPIGKGEFYSYVLNIQMDKEIFIRIGPSRWMNAYCTWFYDFFLDFRFIGVVLGGIIFGIISEIGYKKLIKSNGNVYDMSISLNIVIMIVMSMVRWQFSSANFAMAFIYFFVMKKMSRG